MLGSKKRLIAAVAGTAFVISGCGASGDDGEGTPPPEEQAAASSEQGDAGGSDPAAESGEPKPDLEGVPDVVAEVNGEEISKDDFKVVYESQFQQMAMQSQLSGQEVDQDQLKSATVDGLVDNELLAQDAEKQGISVSDDEAEQELTKLAETNQMSRDDFMAANKEQGLDEKRVLDEVKSQTLIKKLLESENGEFTASEEELQQSYQQVQQQQQMSGQGGQAQQLPPMEQVRPQLQDQVINQKLAEAMQKKADELRKGADVKINI